MLNDAGKDGVGGDNTKAGADNVPKCANVGCVKPGLHICSRCRGVKYCSAACQKVHWKKQCGHKQECLHAAIKAAVPTALAGAGSAGGPEAGACIICLSDDPPPIQSGCACRGDAGLAHVECRAMAAAHRIKSTQKLDGWSDCGTCGQRFTGVMELRLAETWWSMVQRLPEENDERLAAATYLATALSKHGKYAKAERMFRQVLAVNWRMLGPNDPRSMAVAGNIALVLANQGKYTKAEGIQREVLAARQRVLGPDHVDTLMTATRLANVLNLQGNFAAAEKSYREALSVQRRVLGPEHPDTLMTVVNLANVLIRQGDHAAAEKSYREALAVQRRVLGPEHPDTWMTTFNLALALEHQEKFNEAEAMYTETLAVQRRVLGSEHPDTFKAADHLDRCIRSARGNSNSAE